MKTYLFITLLLALAQDKIEGIGRFKIGKTTAAKEVVKSRECSALPDWGYFDD